MAAAVRDKLFGQDSLVDATEFWNEVSPGFHQRAVKPQKYTFLHEFIEYAYLEEEEYVLRKADYEDSVGGMKEVLGLYHVPFETEVERLGPEYDEDDLGAYSDYILELLRVNVTRHIAAEVFTLLYPDRDVLLRLNEIIASFVTHLRREDHPELLQRDGVVRRCRYWPAWLRNAVVFRENGHCPLCGRDISGLLHVQSRRALDHIVPLNLGGTNDPTNLQLLCESCNGSKSGEIAITSSSRQLFWSDD